MLGKAFKKAVTKPVTGGVEAELFDETGVDIAEALDIVNNSVDDDASKDFNEKEIAVIGNIMSSDAKSKIKNFEFSIEKICSPGPKLSNCPVRMGKKEEDEFFKRNLLQLLQIDVSKTDVKRIINQKYRVPQIKENLKESIRRGRNKALKEKSIQSHFNFPLLNKTAQSPKKMQRITEKECEEDLKAPAGKPLSSFAENLSPNNDCERSLVFKTKCFTNSRWLRAEVTVRTSSKVVEILTNVREFPIMVISIKNITFVKVEENQLVIWIQEHSHRLGTDASKKDINDRNFEKALVGIQLSSIKDCSALLLALDYLSQCSWPRRSHLLEGGRISEPVPDKPVLYSVLVGWIYSGSGVTLEFVGKYRYNLKSAQKEIKSLEAAYFYLKAGVLYIYEFEIERLPFFSLPLGGSILSVICSDNPCVRIGQEGVGDKKGLQLVIFTETVEEALRMERTAQIAESWRQTEDNDGNMIPCQLGVCDDRLLCLKQETQPSEDTIDTADLNVLSSEDKDGLQTRTCSADKYSPMNLVLGPVAVVSTSLGLHKNPPELGLAWSRGWDKVLHLAVDYDNCNIQIAWLSELPLDPKDHRSVSLITTSNCAPPHKLLDPDLGGMAIFANMTELSKFVQTVQNCAGSVAVLPINSRHSQKLALS
eukprot:TRINITY_DN26971_c0_g1_i5.p1 TRINITY_DN26971_c0_g1~~TRINITY_DN26971_c0_g1_i5.p1  ORF type:complete len:650 (-),score=145.70 TRINITY_DN26971_c0_g1_i5:33-1982(-)